MDLITPFIIGIALSMDCLAVSLAIGISTKTAVLKTALIIALCFGAFQSGMTLLGWLAGSGFADMITGFDHWLAFLLLALIGAKMIREGFEDADEEDDEQIGALAFVPVMMLSLATSIDALAVGVSFAFLHMDILVPALIIGVVALILSFAGVLSGMQLKAHIGKHIEILGGIILILIGMNIVASHLGMW